MSDMAVYATVQEGAAKADKVSSDTRGTVISTIAGMGL